MTNHRGAYSNAKVLSPNTLIQRRAPRNNLRKIKPHGAPYSRVPTKRSRDTNHQSRAPIVPVPRVVPPLQAPLLPGLLRKAKAGNDLITETVPRIPNWSKEWNVSYHPSSIRPAPYESVSTPWNSRRSLTNALTPLSTTSSKVNTARTSESNNVNTVYNNPSSKISPKNSNAQQSTHRSSQVKLPLPLRKKTARPRSTAGPSSPKGKRSPVHTAKRRPTLPPLPPLSLERPVSPQEPSLNPRQWKRQVRVSNRHNVPPEHAPRPENPVFPLVSPSLRENLSPRLRNHHGPAPLSSSGHGRVAESHKSVNANNTGVTRVVHHPPREHQHVMHVEKPELHVSFGDDLLPAQTSGQLVKPRAPSSLRELTTKVARQPAVETVVTKPRPTPRKEKSPTDHTSQCKPGAGEPSVTNANANTLEEVKSANLRNAQEMNPRKSVPHAQSQRAKKRRVVENEYDPTPRVSVLPTDGSSAPAGLDLTQIDLSRTPTNKKVDVSPISITEAPFEISFEDPAVAELRNLNGGDNSCFLGDSVKTVNSGVPAALRRRCLSFERKRLKGLRPVYIANPHEIPNQYEMLMMDEALAAVNVRFEK